ncbi:pseudouridine synthase 10 [Tachypleus tridentatus]|uniref:pseudouridine synthase 10 n=1 Tax=Tachypleus tridentatus TaxID=6853 RepID=UPI003FD44432
MKSNKEVFKKLTECGCCDRCILRFFREKKYYQYASIAVVRKRLEEFIDDTPTALKEEICDSKNENEIINEKIEEPPFKKHLKSPCSACLGLLEEQHLSEGLNKLLTTINESGHKFSVLTLQLSVPPSIDLRQHLLLLFLRENFSDFYNTVSDEDVPSVKDAWKWVVGNKLGDALKIDFSPTSDFQINVQVSHSDVELECEFLEKLSPETFPNRRLKNLKNKRRQKNVEVFTRSAVLRALSVIPEDKLKLNTTFPPQVTSFPCQYENISCTHSPLYLAGRYNKYSRELCQTPWLIEGEKKMETSVQDLIVDVVKKFIVTDKIVFSSSGREDVDVRMLGEGRPFVLELQNPRSRDVSQEFINKIEKAINGSTSEIAVRDFQDVRKEDVHMLKEGEEEKRKTYSAICVMNRPLTKEDIEQLKTLKDLVIQQKTPLRVLHRRPLAVRERIVYEMSAEKIDEHRFQLSLSTQAGTYVKEFVHGDFGRTVPHLGSILGAETDIMELDVQCIDLHWPPKKI